MTALGVRPARTRDSTASARSAGSTFHDPRSLSTNTGVAPRYRMGLTLAEKVSVLTTTSSPGPTPARMRAR